MKKFFILVSIVSTFLLRAQESESVYSGKAVSFLPQYFINNGIRVDFDFRIKNNHWIQVCPLVYAADKSGSSNERYSTLAGAGLMLYHRKYLYEYNTIYSLYVNYGASCSYFAIQYPYQTISGSEPTETSVLKTGADVNLGIRQIHYNKLMLDAFIGMGLRYSFHNDKGPGNERFNNNYWDFGYTGVMLTGGIRIGLMY